MKLERWLQLRREGWLAPSPLGMNISSASFCDKCIVSDGNGNGDGNNNDYDYEEKDGNSDGFGDESKYPDGCGYVLRDGNGSGHYDLGSSGHSIACRFFDRSNKP